jgi:hypothetical protein
MTIFDLLWSTISYAVSFDGKVFFCRMCGMASHNPQDVENRYCGHCHCFHDNEALERVLAQKTGGLGDPG